MKKHPWVTTIVGFGLWALLTITMVGCVSVPVEVPQISYEGVEVRHVNMKMDFGRDNPAETNCYIETDKPVILIDSFWVGKPLYKHLMFHELRHVRQIAEHGKGCIAFLADYNAPDPDFRYRIEVEAECGAIAAGKMSVRDANVYKMRMVSYFMLNYKRFGMRLSEAVIARVEEVCNREERLIKKE
jgi:hypothetical protein